MRRFLALIALLVVATACVSLAHAAPPKCNKAHPCPSPSLSPSSSPSPSPSPSPPPGCNQTFPNPKPMDDKPHSETVINCVTIDIDNDAAQWWTAQQVYDYLAAEALNLDIWRSELFIEVRSDTTYQYQSAMVASLLPSTCQSQGIQTCTWVPVITLIADPSRHQFIAPGFEPAGYEHYAEPAISHEYGHVWTMYYLYFVHGNSWADYIAARNMGNSTDPVWEVAAEDYRMCFGSPWAQALDRFWPDIGKPTPEFCNWMATAWRPT